MTRPLPSLTAFPPFSLARPLFVEGEAFDCRLLLGGRILQLGQMYERPVKFLNPDLVLSKLSPGKPIKLWESKDIAKGKVVRLGT